MLVWFVRELGWEPKTFSARTTKEPRERPPFLFWHYADRKRRKRWCSNYFGCCSDVGFLGDESLRTDSDVQAVELGRQYFRYAPLSMSDLLMAAFWTFLLTAVLVGWGQRERVEVQAAQLTRLLET